MFQKNRQQLMDHSQDFDDLQNPNDSSRVGLVNTSMSHTNRGNNYQQQEDQFESNINAGQQKGYNQNSFMKNSFVRSSVNSQESKNSRVHDRNHPQNNHRDQRRGSNNQQYESEHNENSERRHHQRSQRSQNSYYGMDSHYDRRSGAHFHQSQNNNNGPNNSGEEDNEEFMIPGELNENVNKRSESANRKYQQGKNPKKQSRVGSNMFTDNASNKEKEGTIGGKDDKVGDDKADFTNNGMAQTPTGKGALDMVDELSQSDADDDFDDRYIHLIAAHSEINKAWGVIYPDSTFKGCWDLVGLICIIYQSIIVPFRLCFEVEATGGLAILEQMIDVVFMIDILINFNTGFYKKGYLVMKRKEIINNYIKTWFFIDLISSFPYTWILTGEGLSGDSEDSGTTTSSNGHTTTQTPQLLRLIKVIRFLRFLRLLRVLKLKKLLYKFEEIIMSDTLNAILGFFKVITVILFIAHWIACIFYAIGASQLDSEPICWLTLANIQDADTFDKYIISLYWAFTTMTTVGYGDVAPYTMSEKIYAMFSMLIACGVFAYVVGSIETIARRSNTMAAIFKEKILHVNQFLMHKQIPKYLRLKVRRYLEYMFEYKKQYKLSEIEVLNMLNENLKDQVIVHLNGRMLKNTLIFGKFDQRFLSEVTFLLLNETFSMDDHIFEEDEKGTKMYFITKGTVVIMQKKSHTYIKELQVDEYFGEISFFSDLNRQATARSRGFTEVLSLNKDNFIETAFTQYPDADKKYKEIHHKLTNENDYNSIYVSCYLCGKQGHISVNCGDQFEDIKGNLKKQIYKMRQKMRQDQRKLMEEQALNKDGADDLTKAQEGADDEETEEIKTEQYLTSGTDNESSSSSNNEDDTKSISRKGNDSRKGSIISNITNNQKSPPGKLGGGFRLGISVGAQNIETAEKYKKIDQELQQKEQSSTIVKEHSTPQKKSSDEDDVQQQIQQQMINIEQDIPQEQPKLITDKSKQIRSTHQMLLGLVDQQPSSSNINVKQNSSKNLTQQVKQQDSLKVQSQEQDNTPKSKIQGATANNMMPKSILKKSSNGRQDSLQQQQQPQQQLNVKAVSNNQISSGDYHTSSNDSLDVKLRESYKNYSKKSSQKSPMKNQGMPQQSTLIEAKVKTGKSNVRDSQDAVNQPYLVIERGASNRQILKEGSSKNINGGAPYPVTKQGSKNRLEIMKNAQSKFKSSEQQIDQLMKHYSPFNMKLDIQRERSDNLASFLPSFHEHKQAILNGNINSISKAPQDEVDYRKQFLKRSGTLLLGQIKENHNKKEAKVGVVPKDLPMSLLHDLLDEEDQSEELDQEMIGNQQQPKRQSPKKKKSSLKRKQTLKH